MELLGGGSPFKYCHDRPASWHCAIQALLDANPADSANLTADERKVLEDVKAAAEAAQADGTKSVEELNAAAGVAQAALDTAEGQITDNKMTAADELAPSGVKAEALSADKDLPADAKVALDKAIADAETAKAKALADKFRKNNAVALDKALNGTALSTDEYAKVKAALEEYSKLSPAVQKLLGKEKAALDAAKQKYDNQNQPAKAGKDNLAATGSGASVVLLVSALLALLGAGAVVGRKKNLLA